MQKQIFKQKKIPEIKNPTFKSIPLMGKKKRKK